MDRTFCWERKNHMELTRGGSGAAYWKPSWMRNGQNRGRKTTKQRPTQRNELRTAWTNNKLGLGTRQNRHRRKPRGVIPSGICWMRKMTEWVFGNHTGGITNGM